MHSYSADRRVCDRDLVRFSGNSFPDNHFPWKKQLEFYLYIIYGVHSLFILPCLFVEHGSVILNDSNDCPLSKYVLCVSLEFMSIQNGHMSDGNLYPFGIYVSDWNHKDN